MDLEFRCFADRKPKLPGERIVAVREVPWRLSAVRYAFQSVADYKGEAPTRTRWHDAADFQAEDGLLLFHVPAGVANGLEPGGRYRVAVTDAASKQMLRGEILWELNPPLWTPKAMDVDAEAALAPPAVPDTDERLVDPSPRRGPSKWMLGIALSVLLVPAIWLVLLGPDPEVRPQPSPERNPANHPPAAPTISLAVTAGQSLVVDTREHARDPDGDAPRLLEVEPAQYGVVERIDTYAFRYSAPPRPRETDVFLYRVVDDSSATGDGWVFVTVGTGSQPPAATTSAPLDRAVSTLREPPETEALPTESERRSIDMTASTHEAIGSPATEAVPSESVVPEVAPPMRIASVALQSGSKPDSPPELERFGPGSAVITAGPETLRSKIADALDAEDLQRVRSLCGEAMTANASLAKLCGIVFDPNKQIFEAHPDATFALACYDQAARLGDAEARVLAEAVRPFAEPRP